MPDVLVYVALFVLGLIIGSFLNVCIWRIPKGESIVKAPSHCVACGARVKPYDLIPLISYIILAGKCRSCKAKISLKYPFVELITGLGFALLYLFPDLRAMIVFYAALYAALVTLSFIDFEHKIIPDGIVIFLLAAGVLYNAASFALNQDLFALIPPVAGFFAASVPMYILALIYKGGMGGGDIKLMAVCGLFLGWSKILLALFIAAAVACIFVLIGSLFKIRKQERSVVFGPFLSVGIMAALIYGDSLIGWYLKIIL